MNKNIKYYRNKLFISLDAGCLSYHSTRDYNARLHTQYSKLPPETLDVTVRQQHTPLLNCTSLGKTLNTN